MKRKTYMTPTMNIVKLQHQSHLLEGSGVAASRSGYGNEESQDWGD